MWERIREHENTFDNHKTDSSDAAHLIEGHFYHNFITTHKRKKCLHCY